MVHNPHNFYMHYNICYILSNKKHWLSHYAFNDDGVYSKYYKNKNMLKVDCNIISSLYDYEDKIINKITGKTYDWFI